MKTEFDSELVCRDNDKYIKTKLKIYACSMITSFQTKNMREKKAPCKGLSIAMLDFVIKAKNPQGILEECKYEQERIKMENLFDDDLEKSLSD